ncbi:MAG: ABC-F family ATP-binding cassette domain-containing protein [Lachnospiraceae bacterium]|nr:ABC-F family ATP-binding cassette domain-containing protein [Lachnospiraceae bacterium]
MNILTMERFSKAYTDRTLFEDAAFHIQEGEKIGVIGTNGMGKSTLLKILAGIEETDDGEVIMGRNVKMAYLPQTPMFAEGDTVLSAALTGLDKNDMVLVSDAKAMLNSLDLKDFDQPVEQLSGGQKKRAALVNTLLQKVEILILDEPTNHLDNEMARWLEDYLISFRGAVVMVTHDRYFLDRVVDRIVEVEHGKIYSYPGTYAEYVGLKMQRQNIEHSSEKKRQNILRKELAWLHRGARARSTKQKAHIQRIEDLMNQAGPIEEQRMEMSSMASRMGRKTLEIDGLTKAYGDLVLMKDFSYHFVKGDRIGIVGPNGSGKSTLLKMLVGEVLPDAGTIVLGETIKIGYFAQDNVHMNENMKAIEYVREVAEIIQTPDGPVTASALMERFLFDGTMQWSKIGKLSGGERRRLYLLRILMQAPNVLIFDEPTNDLDIQTLSILEDYLDSFDGIVVAVSHDRYFLDRVVNRIFAFEGEGHVQQYEGGYVDYLRSRALRYPEKYTEDGGLKQSQIFGGGAVTDKKPAQKPAEGNVAEKNISSKNWKRSSDQNVSKKLKFTYNEQREYDTIDADIAALEEKLENLDARILQNATNSLKLQELTKEQEEVSRRLEEKMERWMYLTELAEKIAAQNN